MEKSLRQQALDWLEEQASEVRAAQAMQEAGIRVNLDMQPESLSEPLRSEVMMLQSIQWWSRRT